MLSTRSALQQTNRNLTNASPDGSDSAKALATIDVIMSGAHTTNARALYSLSNASTVKKADRVHNAIDPLVAGEMDRENKRLLENANVLVVSKNNDWRYVNQD